MFVCFRRLIAWMSLFFLSACQTSFNDIRIEQLGTIYDLRRDRTLTPTEFVAEIAAAPRLLMGEQHDNRRHHQAQLWLLQQLQQHRPQGSVLMEMLSVDQQPLITDLAANPAACSPCLPEQLQWKKGWNWAFYGEIVQHLIHQRIALVATNLTQAEVQTLMRGAEPIRGYRSTAPEVQQQLAALIQAQHAFSDEETSGQYAPMIRNMVQVQQFRDRRMAEKVLSATTPSLLLAGNHHINRRLGVPLHVADLSPTTEVINLLLGDEVGDYRASDADYFWALP